MKLELKRVDPLRAANIAALVYGLTMCVFALLFSPFILLMGVLGVSEGAGAAGAGFALFMLILYPVMGLVMGWISGLLTSAIYNLIVRWSGGLLFEFENRSPAQETGGD